MPDLVSIFLNLSQALAPIQKLLSGFGYLIGIAFVILALHKFHTIGDSRANAPSQEKMFVPLAFLALGVGLIFLPTALSTMANTVFGSGNVLAYSSTKTKTIQDAIEFLIKTAGLLWFIRGSVLLAHGSEPGVKEGSKGLTFIAAGILALNFDNTAEAITYALDTFFEYMGKARS